MIDTRTGVSPVRESLKIDDCRVLRSITRVSIDNTLRVRLLFPSLSIGLKCGAIFVSELHIREHLFLKKMVFQKTRP